MAITIFFQKRTMKKSQRHNSQRGWFAYELYQKMKKNKKIWLVVGDLGYKVFDQHFADFPDRCLNAGAGEQAMMGIAVGLALEGKIPFVYSITNFLLYRPFETIRNYLQIEKIPVKLVASGRNFDYTHDGWSHWSPDAKRILKCLPNIKQFWPKEKEEVPEMVEKMISNTQPSFISLRR